MKLLIASDLHGSALYTAQLLEAYRRENAQRLILLGDLLYHGPRNDLPQGYAPKEVIALLNPLAQTLSCVRGNCEAEVDQMVLSFPVLSDCLLLFWQGRTLYLHHGHHPLPPLPQGSVALQGHTHIPGVTQQDGVTVLNPGSVSLPKEDSPHSYLTLEGDTFRWHQLDGRVYNEYQLPNL